MDCRKVWILLALALPTQAFGSGTAYRSIDNDVVSFSDRGAGASVAIEHTRVTPADLRGTWQAHSASGVITELELTAHGGFVFDSRDSHSPQRLYMCGSWSTSGKDIALDVQAHKEQLASGRIIEKTHPAAQTLSVLAARNQLLVLRLTDGATLNFRRIPDSDPNSEA